MLEANINVKHLPSLLSEQSSASTSLCYRGIKQELCPLWSVLRKLSEQPKQVLPSPGRRLASGLAAGGMQTPACSLKAILVV